ncbi:tetratricopeptide repeat protein [Vibrio maritimus]
MKNTIRNIFLSCLTLISTMAYADGNFINTIKRFLYGECHYEVNALVTDDMSEIICMLNTENENLEKEGIRKLKKKEKEGDLDAAFNLLAYQALRSLDQAQEYIEDFRQRHHVPPRNSDKYTESDELARKTYDLEYFIKKLNENRHSKSKRASFILDYGMLSRELNWINYSAFYEELKALESDVSFVRENLAKNAEIYKALTEINRPEPDVKKIVAVANSFLHAHQKQFSNGSESTNYRAWQYIAAQRGDAESALKYAQYVFKECINKVECPFDLPKVFNLLKSASKGQDEIALDAEKYLIDNHELIFDQLAIAAKDYHVMYRVGVRNDNLDMMYEAARNEPRYAYEFAKRLTKNSNSLEPIINLLTLSSEYNPNGSGALLLAQLELEYMGDINSSFQRLSTLLDNENPQAQDYIKTIGPLYKALEDYNSLPSGKTFSRLIIDIENHESSMFMSSLNLSQLKYHSILSLYNKLITSYPDDEYKFLSARYQLLNDTPELANAYGYESTFYILRNNPHIKAIQSLTELAKSYEPAKNFIIKHENLINAFNEAVEGEPIAQYTLAQRYDNGQGVKKNPFIAWRWYALAGHGEKNNLVKAQTAIGTSDYHKMIGYQHDNMNNADILSYAAKQGDSEAQFYYGKWLSTQGSPDGIDWIKKSGIADQSLPNDKPKVEITIIDSISRKPIQQGYVYLIMKGKVLSEFEIKKGKYLQVPLQDYRYRNAKTLVSPMNVFTGYNIDKRIEPRSAGETIRLVALYRDGKFVGVRNFPIEWDRKKESFSIYSPIPANYSFRYEMLDGSQTMKGSQLQYYYDSHEPRAATSEPSYTGISLEKRELKEGQHSILWTDTQLSYLELSELEKYHQQPPSINSKEIIERYDLYQIDSTMVKATQSWSVQVQYSYDEYSRRNSYFVTNKDVKWRINRIPGLDSITDGDYPIATFSAIPSSLKTMDLKVKVGFVLNSDSHEFEVTSVHRDK